MSDGVLGLIGMGISLIGTIGITIYNQRSVKKQNAENERTQRMVRASQKDFEVQILAREQEFQEKLTQKQIDANLKAKARIEWINDVRGLAARFISNFYELKKNETDFEEKYIEIFKDAELLKLYFGTYVDEKVTNTNYELLFNMKDNQNKNVQIFKFIDTMLDDLDEKGIAKYQSSLKKYDEYKLKFKKCEEAMRECYTVEKNELGNYEEVIVKEKEALYDHIYGELQDLKKESSVYYHNLRQYDQRITDFEKIISIYLKIEWDKAKKGE
ncbi:hypothetical protein DUI35_10925 [Enterococcus faecium]|uniref:hypothetical protein n=1 Tax=Enterococcus faecium TaxID=1352 RepID=UPI0019F461E0|nr:hypothetical protein [Enterococcus faecium]EGP5585208.1 hypothetical protein [Enterococcus faecium]